MNPKISLFNVSMVLCIFSLSKVTAQNPSASGIDGTIIKEFEDVTLKCDVTGISTFTMEWQRNGVKLEAGKKYTMNLDERSMSIVKAGRSDVGEYVCMFIPDPASAGTGKASATVYLRSPPFVDPFSKSVTGWEGGSASIQCKAYGYPTPTITWYKAETPEEDDQGNVLKISENKTVLEVFNDVANAKLTINELVSEDRFYYGCQASDGVNSTMAKCLLRVKSRYAALWPFIGIILEVIVLVIVIIIYERRKRKGSADDDSDSGERTNSQEQRGDARRRNVPT